jgi:ubiquinone/menaquinone biosynthesis C-methylase UbiE
MDTAAKYVSADPYRDDVDVQLDMSKMSSVADGSFDLVIACDVLEHVPDDAAAFREIHRVLTVDGWVILTVPQKDNLTTTFSDNTVLTPEGRKQAFGQEDHLRIYGDDFGQILESHGFAVTIVDAQNFSTKIVQKYVLVPPFPSSHPLATNHRRVYFAQAMRQLRVNNDPENKQTRKE